MVTKVRKITKIVKTLYKIKGINKGWAVFGILKILLMYGAPESQTSLFFIYFISPYHLIISFRC